MQAESRTGRAQTYAPIVLNVQSEMKDVVSWVLI